MSTISTAVIRTAVADVLHARRQRLLNRTTHNPHAASESRDAGRRQEIVRLQSACVAVQSMHVEGDVHADMAALLIAWASGWQAAIAQLEAIDPRVEMIDGRDVVGACRLLLSGAEDGRN